MNNRPDHLELFSRAVQFDGVDWNDIPAAPGVYVIQDLDEIVYVGMAGRNGKGSLRNRLRSHSTGQIVNKFAQYLFLDRVQFLSDERITHPRDANVACRQYIRERCSFRILPTVDAQEARSLEDRLRAELRPTLNP